MRRGWAAAGAWCWVTALQFYVVEWAVSRNYPGYRYADNAISDLGAGTSPAPTAMNASFVLLGLAIAAGGLLLGRTLRGVRWFAVPAGLGVIVVGLFPEDTVGVAHGLGAAAFFVAGNAGLILIGRRVTRRPNEAAPGIGAAGGGALLSAAGCVGLVATALFATGAFGLVDAVGSGTVERLAGYPVSAGYAFAGLVVLAAGKITRGRPWGRERGSHSRG